MVNIEKKKLTPSVLKKAIKDIASRKKEVRVKDCGICKILRKNKKVEYIYEDLPKEINDLKVVMVIDVRPFAIKKCPICERLYFYNEHYEYFVNGASEDNEYLTRVDEEGAFKEMKRCLKYYVDPKYIKKVRGKWTITFS